MRVASPGARTPAPLAPGLITLGRMAPGSGKITPGVISLPPWPKGVAPRPAAPAPPASGFLDVAAAHLHARHSSTTWPKRKSGHRSSTSCRQPGTRAGSQFPHPGSHASRTAAKNPPRSTSITASSTYPGTAGYARALPRPSSSRGSTRRTAGHEPDERPATLQQRRAGRPARREPVGHDEQVDVDSGRVARATEP